MLTESRAVVQELADFTRPAMYNGMGPNSFASTLLEIHRLRYSRLHLSFLLELDGSDYSNDEIQKASSIFSEFDDHTKYNGCAGSAFYWRDIYNTEVEAQETVINKTIRMFSCRIGRADLSYKVQFFFFQI